MVCMTMGSANTGADVLYTERGKAAIQALFESDIGQARLGVARSLYGFAELVKPLGIFENDRLWDNTF